MFRTENKNSQIGDDFKALSLN